MNILCICIHPQHITPPKQVNKNGVKVAVNTTDNFQSLAKLTFEYERRVKEKFFLTLYAKCDML